MLTSNLDWNLNFAKFNSQYYSISSDACMHEAWDFFRHSTRYRSIDFVYNLVSAEHVALNLSQWKLPHHSPSGRRSDKNTYRILWQICAQKPISFCSMSRITITSRAFAQHVVHEGSSEQHYTPSFHTLLQDTHTHECVRQIHCERNSRAQSDEKNVSKILWRCSLSHTCRFNRAPLSTDLHCVNSDASKTHEWHTEFRCTSSVRRSAHTVPV